MGLDIFPPAHVASLLSSSAAAASSGSHPGDETVTDNDDDDDIDHNEDVDDDQEQVDSAGETRTAQYLRCYACPALQLRMYAPEREGTPVCTECGSDFVEIVSSFQVRQEQEMTSARHQGQALDARLIPEMILSARHEGNVTQRRQLQYQLLRELFLSSSLGMPEPLADAQSPHSYAQASGGQAAEAGAGGGVEGQEREVHANIICDGCQMQPIVGARWKCSTCADFDFCSLCHAEFVSNGRHSLHIAGTCVCVRERECVCLCACAFLCACSLFCA